MEWELILRWVHIIGASVLLGTGAGIAFFMLMAHLNRQAAIIAHTASVVVVADIIFTATAVILQPISGVALAIETGWPLSSGWILLSLLLYGMVGLFWLPVIWIQIQMRNLARTAAARDQSLPAAYDRLFYIWFACGIPAFLGVLAIIWLMVARPAFDLVKYF